MFRRILCAIASSLALSGCVLATPFQGPGYDRETGIAAKVQGPLVASVTYAKIRDDGDNRQVFFDYVERVEAILPQRKGFVGYSKRADFLGNEAWTLSVWKDKESLIAFLESDEHTHAVDKAMRTLEDGKFARLSVTPDELPVPWERALAALEANGRYYYE